MAKSCANVTEARLAAKTLTEHGFTGGQNLTVQQRWNAAGKLVDADTDELYPGESFFEGMMFQVTPDFCLDVDIRSGKRRRADTMLHIRLKANPRAKLPRGCGQTLHYCYLTVKPGWEARLEKDLANAREIAESLQEKTPRCPICSDLMVTKQMNKTGHPHEGEEFWGCWKYPDCHGMRADWQPVCDDPEVGKVLKDLRCPECGGIMVVRMVRKGDHAGWKFYGCQQYPSCKGTLGRADAVAQMLMRDQGDDGRRGF